ncbi:hypothetical protein Xen7305DRAFT_00033250, partial [Xenococcus sp. PCC 7305]
MISRTRGFRIDLTIPKSRFSGAVKYLIGSLV